MARIVGAAAEAITQATIDEVTYTVALIDPADEDADTPIEHHTDAILVVADVIFDTLQLDARWTADATGYNFRHTVDVSANPAFEIRGREYRVLYKLLPVSGQVIVIAFRLSAV